MRAARKFVAVLVCASLGVLLAPARAEAFAPPPLPVDTVPIGVSSADEAAYPAGVIVDLVGNLLPQAKATDSISYALSNFAKNGGIAANLVQGYQMAQHVPGFRLGTKIGGWIDQAMGFAGQQGDGPAPATNFVPYSDTAGVGWSPFTQPWAYGCPLATDPWSMCSSSGSYQLTGVGVTPNASVLVAGQTVPAGAVIGTNSFTVSGDSSSTDVAQPAPAVMCADGSGLTVNGPLVWTDGSYNEPYTVGSSPICDAASTGGFASLSVQNPSSSNAPDVWTSGAVLGPAGVAGSTREWDMATTCADGFVNHQYSASFLETATNFAGVPSPWDCGSHGLATGWTWSLDNGSGVVIEQLESWAVPASVPALTTTYPACATQLCSADLWKIDTTTGARTDCFQSQALCDGWATDPNRSTDYVCTYGPQGSAGTDIAISGCYLYGPTFNLQKRAAGVMYSDPATDPATAGTAVNSPAPVTVAGGASGSSSSCFPSGFGVFNPVEWVLKPVECAMVWAFEPDTTALASSLDQARTTLAARPPFSLVATFYSLLTGVVGGYSAGCPVSGFIADFGDKLRIPCVNPIAADGAFQMVYGLAQVAIAGVTALGVWRMVEDGLPK